MFLRITSDYFCAGITNNNVAPIIKYMKNWSEDKIYEYCNKKGWKVENLSKKKPGMFDIFTQILTKNVKYPYNKKLAPAYMMSLYLSHDNSLLKIVNAMNKIQFTIPDEIIYRYYFDRIPKRRYIKWVKKTPEDKKLNKIIEQIQLDMNVSKNEAKMILSHIRKIKD